jgi:hypothetical protein
MINLTDLSDEFAAPASVPTRAPRLPVTSKLKSLFAHASQAIVASRQDQANRYVRAYFARQDDAELARLGISAAEIVSIRDGTWRPNIAD